MLSAGALKAAFARRMLHIFGLRPPKKLGMSVSGGVDSMALASLTAQWANLRNVHLHAFIVNHNLRQNSAEEAAAVSQSLQHQLNVESSILDLSLDSHPSRIEELARKGRRSALEDACATAEVTDLLLGHHLNDQVELFIQRLLGGSSWFGLAGMATKTLLQPLIKPEGPPPVTLVRPLLQFRKLDLQSWCIANNVPWWEDPTNQDITLTKRNLIRRMYTLEQEPSAFSVESVSSLVDFFGQQRIKTVQAAQLAYDQLLTSGRLVYESGVARLELGPDIRALALAVRMELLLRILAPISPYTDDKMFTRRHRLRPLAEEIVNGRQQLRTAFGVVVSGANSRWTFFRETVRRNVPSPVEIYRAGPAWSAWTLLDNRWWVRWKLPASEKSPKFFSVRMLARPEVVLKALAAVVSKDSLQNLRRVCTSHPFLMWSDPASPDAFELPRLIGFPTLSVTRGLVFEVKPKEYAAIDC